MVRIDDILGPVDEHRPWYMARFVFVAGGRITRLLPAATEIGGIDVPADVDHLQSRFEQVIPEPRYRHQVVRENR